MRLAGTLAILCALQPLARAEEDELPAGVISLPDPERVERLALLPPDPNEPGDASKIRAAAPDKGPAPMAKNKTCCGYPLAASEPGFKISFYWLAYEQEYANEPYDTDIYTRQGYWIGRYPSAFVFELRLEGSGILRDGRVLNFAGDCNYGIGTCFKFLELDQHPLGVGVQGRKLEPFRSVAVDPKMIPIGAPVFIPELAGLPMPDGSTHDGCVRADDMGGAIKNGKIDFFVESYANFKWIADALWHQYKITPTVEEPRCEYLRVGDPREHDNEHSDWASLHQRWRTLARAERVAAARTARNRRLAQKWLKRHATKAHSPVAKR